MSYYTELEIMQGTEVHNFTQEDLLTEDIMILDCHNAIHEWVGQHTNTDNKERTLDIAKVGCFLCCVLRIVGLEIEL